MIDYTRTIFKKQIISVPENLINYSIMYLLSFNTYSVSCVFLYFDYQYFCVCQLFVTFFCVSCICCLLIRILCHVSGLLVSRLPVFLCVSFNCNLLVCILYFLSFCIVVFNTCSVSCVFLCVDYQYFCVWHGATQCLCTDHILIIFLCLCC